MPGLASCRMKWPGPDPSERCPYLAIHSHGWLVLFCLPPAKQTQVILVLQLGLSEAGSPGPVGIAFHHLHQREQPVYNKGYHFLSAYCIAVTVLSALHLLQNKQQQTNLRWVCILSPLWLLVLLPLIH